MGCLCDQCFAAGQSVFLFGKCTLGPVDESVRPDGGAVQVVHAPGQGATVVPQDPFFSDTIIISVDKPPDLRWGTHPHLVAYHADSLRQHQVVCEDRAPVEDAVAVVIHQSQHAVRFLLGLDRRRFVGSGTLRHIQPAPRVEHGADRPVHQG